MVGKEVNFVRIFWYKLSHFRPFKEAREKAETITGDGRC